VPANVIAARVRVHIADGVNESFLDLSRLTSGQRIA